MVEVAVKEYCRKKEKETKKKEEEDRDQEDQEEERRRDQSTPIVWRRLEAPTSSFNHSTNREREGQKIQILLHKSAVFFFSFSFLQVVQPINRLPNIKKIVTF